MPLKMNDPIASVMSEKRISHKTFASVVVNTGAANRDDLDKKMITRYKMREGMAKTGVLENIASDAVRAGVRCVLIMTEG